MKKYDVVVIGGGPAGMGASLESAKTGAKTLLIERDSRLGGILNQCIHNGFGLHYFKEELTGPEYAYRFKKLIDQSNVDVLLDTFVTKVDGKSLTIMSPNGVQHLEPKSIVYAMGCREKTAGSIRLNGTRPVGVMTAGQAQKLVNYCGKLPGKKVVILGSGDIGLIMARRMTLEGAKVKVVAELMPYSGGLKRNIVQCLDDFGIPLKLSHTVVDIKGRERVEGITLAQVDGANKPIPGTEEFYSCDTLLLSVGLIPENELSRGMGVEISSITSGPIVNESLETNIEGVFACGNVLHVHDLVDYVSEEAKTAGKNATIYVKKLREEKATSSKCENVENKIENVIQLVPNDGVRYTVPSFICVTNMAEELVVRFRVGAVYRNAFISVYYDNKRVIHRKRLMMAPGEMEEVKLKKEQLEQYPDIQKIMFQIEEI